MWNILRTVVLVLCLLSGIPKGLSQTTFQWDTTSPPRSFRDEPVPTYSQSEAGTCICDLTYDDCDWNCACDADCTTETTLFTTSLPEGPVKDIAFKCVDPDLIEVNKRGGLSTTLLNNLLCIEEDNNEAKGPFLVDPSDSVGTTDFDEQRAKLSTTFQSTGSIEPVTAYVAGSNVMARFAGVPFNNGYWPLPGPGLTGACTDRRFAQFNVDVPASDDNNCILKTTDMASECATRFTSAPYASSSLSIGSSGTTGGYRVLSFSSVSLIVAGARVTNTAEPPAASYVAADSTCYNALTSVHYTVVFQITIVSGASVASIVSVSAEVYLDDLVHDTSGSYTHTQSFTVSWVESGSATPDNIPVVKSGNPGYMVGNPVLAGVYYDDTVLSLQGIQRYVNGLGVLSHSVDGQCDTTGAGTPFYINFGEDALFSCSFKRDKAGMTDMCTGAADTSLTDMLTLPDNLRIGYFGNADFYNLGEWMDVTKTLYERNGLIDSQTSVCTVNNVLNIEFLTADVGSVLNPQSKILSARTTYSATADWAFRSTDTASTESFNVYVSVTFVKIPSGSLETFDPPAPPVFPRLSRDVLYPFDIGDSPAPGANSFISLTMISTISIISILISKFY